MNKIKVSASLLSADFRCLGSQIKRLESAGADMLHIDVMDGHFVDNITIGPVVLKDIRKATKLILDVHLMIRNPQNFIKDFLSAGSDMITVHVETLSPNQIRLLSANLRARRIKFGISLNPATSLEKIKGVLKYADFILIMSVNPGFAGQGFIQEVVPKIKQLRAIFKKDIAVDGGINADTAKRVVAAGANVLAAGSYIFKSKDYAKAIRSLRCRA
jgi:ribulose-phosphate 3-epimerase